MVAICSLPYGILHCCILIPVFERWKKTLIEISQDGGGNFDRDLFKIIKTGKWGAFPEDCGEDKIGRDLRFFLQILYH